MARTAITITNVGRLASGAALTGTVGDEPNDHSLYSGPVPRLILLFANYHVSPITVTITHGATSKTPYYGQQQDQFVTLPASPGGGIPSILAISFDTSAGLATNDDDFAINSADANFNLVRLYSYTWTPSAYGER